MAIKRPSPEQINQAADTRAAYRAALSNGYADHTGRFWSRFPQPIVDDFTNRLSGIGRTVLNIGSGPGRDSMRLRQNGANVTCLDTCEEMVRETTGLGFISYQASFTEMGFLPDGAFDGVWAYKSLVHVPFDEVIDVMLEIRRVLAENGPLGVGWLKGQNAEIISTTWGHDRLNTYLRPSGLRRLLNRGGFKLVTDITTVPNGKAQYLCATAVKIP